MSCLSREKLSEDVSKHQRDAEREPGDKDDDDRTKPLLERLKALEVNPPVPTSVPPPIYLKVRSNTSMALRHVTLDSFSRN